jgi:hypothetical protein
MTVESLTLLEQRQPFLNFNVPQFEMKKKMVKRKWKKKRLKVRNKYCTFKIV